MADVMNRDQRGGDVKAEQALGALGTSSIALTLFSLVPVDRGEGDTMHEIRKHDLTDTDVRSLLMADLNYAAASVAAFKKHLTGRELDRDTAHDLREQAEDLDAQLCEMCVALARHLHRDGEGYCDTHQDLFVECDWCHEWVLATETTTVDSERHVAVVCRPCYEVGQDW